MDFDTLREANVRRQGEWDPTNSISLSYRGNEMGGEVGEALEKAIHTILVGVASGKAQNIMKKLERERLGIRGSRSTVHELAQELADVVICVDLIAAAEGIDLAAAVQMKFNETSVKLGLKTLL